MCNCPRQKVTFLWFACCSQKESIAELKTQLDEERDQRIEEREKAVADLKASIQRVQSEAEEELKRTSDAASRREREQQEVIGKLQESERESSSLVENLRSKLEDTRQKLVFSDNRVCQLEAQVLVEQQSSAVKTSRMEELESETRRMRKDLDKEKKASIAELKTQLDEERDQRREEREKAVADLKAYIQRV
ncbi:uncharacterized protein [Spinacia oleracea]|uniref:Myosin tail domain-containing protein n=1 Tax=Spinacia oleracea TaxID=3562 RepID=A0ABM3RP50_SPIOL|nr:uncharacterized protein LOC130471356 [Spinacia oleracea]